MTRKGLAVGLGNPILSDDAVGLYVVRRLEQLWEARKKAAPQHQEEDTHEWQFIEFDGNPLDLIHELTDVDTLLVIDAWYPHDGGPVAVVDLNRAAENSQTMMATDSHGVNVLEMLTLAHRLSVAEPEVARLILIPVNDPFSLGHSPTEHVLKNSKLVTEYIWGRWFQHFTAQQFAGVGRHA